MVCLQKKRFRRFFLDRSADFDTGTLDRTADPSVRISHRLPGDYSCHLPVERALASGWAGAIYNCVAASIRGHLVDLFCESRIDCQCHTWLVFCTPFNRWHYALLGPLVGYSQAECLVR